MHLERKYLQDKNLQIQPYNVKGEICVGGLGVCKGYLNRPELNKQKFVKNPYNPSEILFRSADSAILTPSGDLHYIGRMDKQVKLRGFRIEIGEIENKLLKHPNVKKCVVLPKQNGNVDSYLVAYIVANDVISPDELKDFIRTLVPSYMIPSYFVFLDKIPINTNGKTDKKALLDINIQSTTDKKYIAPRNDFEKTFQIILERNLQVKKIGIDDDILNLGADSLTLMRITIELLEKNYIVNIQDIYEQKTIRRISDNFFYPKKSNVYTLKHEKDIYNNWRGYEIKNAQKQWRKYNTFEMVFGGGVQKQIKISNLLSHFTRGAGYTFQDNKSPILHNGYYTLLVKGGILAIIGVLIWLFAPLVMLFWKKNDEESKDILLLMVSLNAMYIIYTYVVRGVVDQIIHLSYGLTIGWLNACYYNSDIRSKMYE